MGDKPSNKNKLEISSDQLKGELSEIKDRVGALETIASIANKSVVEAYVREHLTSDKGKQIMAECAVARTRPYLQAKFGFKTPQALDYYLTPLRDDHLLHQHFDDNGTQTFEWSYLFRRLPKKTVREILNGSS